MNIATFAGRIGRDAEVRHTQGGNSVAGFSLAVEERRGGEKTTLWIDCSMWGERAEKLAEYLTKGSAVTVSGQVGVRTYESQGETRAAITLNVREVTLQGGGSREGDDRQAGGQRQAPARQAPARQAAQQQPARSMGPTKGTEGDFDDDIPF